MRFKKRTGVALVEADLTPMIDMTFQLIAFFMVVLNFAETEQDERIKLPSSQIVKPPDAPFEYPITLQLTKQGMVLYGGGQATRNELRGHLRVERQLLESRGLNPREEATIIIRADAAVAIGEVQQLMQMCDDYFGKIALRAKQEEAPSR